MRFLVCVLDEYFTTGDNCRPILTSHSIFFYQRINIPAHRLHTELSTFHKYLPKTVKICESNMRTIGNKNGNGSIWACMSVCWCLSTSTNSSTRIKSWACTEKEEQGTAACPITYGFYGSWKLKWPHHNTGWSLKDIRGYPKISLSPAIKRNAWGVTRIWQIFPVLCCSQGILANLLGLMSWCLWSEGTRGYKQMTSVREWVTTDLDVGKQEHHLALL